MPQSYKILGQIEPTKDTDTNVYVTGAAASAIVGTFTLDTTRVIDPLGLGGVANVFIRPINETLTTKHYIMRSAGVNSNSITVFTGAFTMQNNVILGVSSNMNNVVFQASGVEIT
jgi:hypothetical protein